MDVTVWIKHAMVLHKIEQSIVKDSDTAMHVSPEPFYPLVVNRASHDNTPSVSPSMCEHVTSNPNVFTSFITSYT